MGFTTDGINFNYDASSEDRTLQAHQYLVDSTYHTGSHLGLKDGPKTPMNGQGCTREQSHAMGSRLKK